MGFNRIHVAVALILVGGGLGVIVSTSNIATADDSLRAGSVELVDSVDRSRALTQGDSNTVFSLRLPDRAACPGDSANDDYRVQTFIVPATDDPGSFEYGLIRPKGGGRNALYRIGSAYANEMTGQNSGPGEPGEIVTLPPLTFAAFPPEWIPPGRYRFGVACTLRAQTTRYWDGELVMSEAPEVQPGQRRWTVIPPSDPLDASSSSGSTWILVAVGIGAVSAPVYFIRRRAVAERMPTKERT